ncbi:MAG: hypothetical protein WKG07_40945 [Hymenobacter sp.]
MSHSLVLAMTAPTPGTWLSAPRFSAQPGFSRKFLASCWLRVEPPTLIAPQARSRPGARQRRRVNARMVIKSRVLGGNQRLNQPGRHLDWERTGRRFSRK